MSLLEALILGAVEGFTEFLPISSTGHLILASTLLDVPQTDFVKTFEVAIQLGAILAVLLLYGRIFLLNVGILKRVFAAFLPTALIGFTLYKIVKQHLFTDEVVLASLFLGGIAIVLFEWRKRDTAEAEADLASISYRQAIIIGLSQSLAIIPGVSRAAATIVGGRAMGLSRRSAVEFSFLLAVPTIGAAALLDLSRNAGAFTSETLGVLAFGILTSFAVAIIAIRLLLRFIQGRTLTAFGIYRMVIAIVLYAVLAF
jgi:undecaprenyl-diphosphatase